jgi:hypothetical protein
MEKLRAPARVSRLRQAPPLAHFRFRVILNAGELPNGRAIGKRELHQKKMHLSRKNDLTRMIGYNIFFAGKAARQCPNTEATEE